MFKAQHQAPDHIAKSRTTVVKSTSSLRLRVRSSPDNRSDDVFERAIRKFRRSSHALSFCAYLTTTRLRSWGCETGLVPPNLRGVDVQGLYVKHMIASPRQTTRAKLPSNLEIRVRSSPDDRGEDILRKTRQQFKLYLHANSFCTHLTTPLLCPWQSEYFNSPGCHITVCSMHPRKENSLQKIIGRIPPSLRGVDIEGLTSSTRPHC